MDFFESLEMKYIFKYKYPSLIKKFPALITTEPILSKKDEAKAKALAKAA